MHIEEVKSAFSEMIYEKYQHDAYMLNSCSELEYSSANANELLLKIDQLSHCNVFKCNNPVIS